MNDANDNMNSFLNKNNNILFMSINDTNLEIQNYNWDVVSIITDENKSITDIEKIAKLSTNIW